VSEDSKLSRLLRREPPAEYLEEYARVVAKPQVREEATYASLFVFDLGPERVALPVTSLQEVLQPPLRIHSLPNRRHPALLGLVNLHGKLEICVSLFALLRGVSRAPQEETRMLVWGSNTQRFVSPITGTHGVVRVKVQELQPFAAGPTSVVESTFVLAAQPVGVLSLPEVNEQLTRVLSR
jgi:chemotaxis-related protein WspD